MEPTDLNPEPSDERLVALLRHPSPAIADDGFARRVLAALPPPRSARDWLVPLVAIVGGASGGLAYALWEGATPGEFRSMVEQLAAIAGQCAPLLGDPWVWLGLVLATASCLTALRIAGALRFR